MKEEIGKLIALQEFDTELAGFDQEIERVKQELADREQVVRDKEALAVQCRQQAAKLEQSRSDIKENGAEAAERIKERQGKMMQVQTSREHQALLKEIEAAKKLIKESEEQQLQVMEEAEAEENRAAELENICKGENKLLAEETVKTEDAVKKLKTRRTTVLNKRNKLAQDIPSSRMKRYDKLLKKRKGLAVVRVMDAVCQGCFMTVPPQQYNEALKGNQLCTCPACQRILYYLADDDSEANG